MIKAIEQPFKILLTEIYKLSHTVSHTYPLAKPTQPVQNQLLQNYCAFIKSLSLTFQKHFKIQEEYQKLEQYLQKSENQIRKSTSCQQQLKLHIDALKVQVQDLENDNQQLKQKNKNLQLQCKRNNDIFLQKVKKIHPTRKNIEAEKGLRDIIKTEYIQRAHFQEKQPSPTLLRVRSKKIQSSSRKKPDEVNQHNQSYNLAHGKMKKKKTSKHTKQKTEKNLSKSQYFHNYTMLQFLALHKKSKKDSHHKQQTSVDYQKVRSRVNTTNKHNNSMSSMPMD